MGDFPFTFLPGIELTHVAPHSIAPLARRAKALGAALVVVHGETIVEPVAPGTNTAAVVCTDVDILAHPGLITLEQAELAAANGVYLEITSRGGHSLSNGHVVQMARQAGARLLVNTDTHAPQDMIDLETAQTVARAAGLDEDEVQAATITNPRIAVERAVARLNLEAIP
jgi:histidinol phosphatase-like PHP family hydrolase